MDNNFSFAVVSIINSLGLMFAMTNLLLFPLRNINKIFIYLFMLFCQLFFGPLLGQHITLFTIGGALLIICASNKHYIFNSIFALLGYLFAIIINYTIISSLAIIKISVSYISANTYYIIIFTLVYGLITYISTYLLGKLIKSKFSKLLISFPKDIQIFLAIELIACTFIFAFNIIQGENEGYPSEIIYFNMILFAAFFVINVIIFLICFRIIYRNQKLQYSQQEKQALLEYMKKLEDLYQDMRVFKHDYINILSTMQCYIEDNDSDGLKTFFESKIVPSSNALANKEAIIGKLSNIKLLELKGILYAKLISAMNQGLDITLEIQDEIQSISMNMLDMSTVIGAFMDNAIEAAKESDDKKLIILLIHSEDSITVVISNSSPAVDIKLDTIYNKDITYKKGHSGLGLYSANKILNKYNNIIHSTNYKSNIFTQTLEICTQCNTKEVHTT